MDRPGTGRERSVVWLDRIYEKSGAEECKKNPFEFYGRENEGIVEKVCKVYKVKKVYKVPSLYIPYIPDILIYLFT